MGETILWNLRAEYGVSCNSWVGLTLYSVSP